MLARRHGPTLTVASICFGLVSASLLPYFIFYFFSRRCRPSRHAPTSRPRHMYYTRLAPCRHFSHITPPHHTVALTQLITGQTHHSSNDQTTTSCYSPQHITKHQQSTTPHHHSAPPPLPSQHSATRPQLRTTTPLGLTTTLLHHA